MKGGVFMSELAEQIYKALKLNRQYNYSEDATIKDLEIKALKELENENYIVIKAKTICYVIVDVL